MRSSLWILAAISLVCATVAYVITGTVPDFLSGTVLLTAGGAAGAHIPSASTAEPVYVPAE